MNARVNVMPVRRSSASLGISASCHARIVGPVLRRALLVGDEQHAGSGWLAARAHPRSSPAASSLRSTSSIRSWPQNSSSLEPQDRHAPVAEVARAPRCWRRRARQRRVARGRRAQAPSQGRRARRADAAHRRARRRSPRTRSRGWHSSTNARSRPTSTACSADQQAAHRALADRVVDAAERHAQALGLAVDVAQRVQPLGARAPARRASPSGSRRGTTTLDREAVGERERARRREVRVRAAKREEEVDARAAHSAAVQPRSSRRAPICASGRGRRTAARGPTRRGCRRRRAGACCARWPDARASAAPSAGADRPRSARARARRSPRGLTGRRRTRTTAAAPPARRSDASAGPCGRRARPTRRGTPVASGASGALSRERESGPRGQPPRVVERVVALEIDGRIAAESRARRPAAGRGSTSRVRSRSAEVEHRDGAARIVEREVELDAAAAVQSPAGGGARRASPSARRARDHDPRQQARVTTSA